MRRISKFGAILSLLGILVLLTSGIALAAPPVGNVDPSFLELYMMPGDEYYGILTIEVNPPPPLGEVPEPDLEEPFKVYPEQLTADPPYIDTKIVGVWHSVYAGQTIITKERVTVFEQAVPGDYLIEYAFPISQRATGYTQNLGKQAILVHVLSPAMVGEIKITGGGQIDPVEEHQTNSFGFNIQPDQTGKLYAHLEYTENAYGNASKKKGADSAFQIKINDYAMNPKLVIDPLVGVIGLKFEAYATVRVQDPGTGEINLRDNITVHVEVIDNGEPGRGADYFKIKFDQDPYIPDYTAEGLLESGNIQLHIR
ncbi:post-COAP-1 domain-containing protein [Chloroflexota bacterium]